MYKLALTWNCLHYWQFQKLPLLVLLFLVRRILGERLRLGCDVFFIVVLERQNKRNRIQCHHVQVSSSCRCGFFLIGNPNGKIAGNKTGITKWRGASCLVAIVVFPGEMLFTYVSASWSQRKNNCLFLLSFGGFLSILSSHYTRWRCCGSWQRICWGQLHALRCLAPVACSWERREHKCEMGQDNEIPSEVQHQSLTVVCVE